MTSSKLVMFCALGMIFSLIGVELSNFHYWTDAINIAFIGKVLVHVGAVFTAYGSGRLGAKEN